MHAFGTSNCTGPSNVLPGEQALGGATDYQCMGNAAFCDVVWMTFWEESAGGDPSWNYTYEQCLVDAVTQGTAAFAVPMDICWMDSFGSGSKTLTCDAMLNITVDIYNDSYCGAGEYLGSDLLIGLDIHNNDTSVACPVFWRSDGGDVCPEPTTTTTPPGTLFM